jgi:phosphate acetyltransferase
MSKLAPRAKAMNAHPQLGQTAGYHVYDQFLPRCKALPAIVTAVVWPMSEVALRGAAEAAAEGLIQPVLVGDEAQIKALAAQAGVPLGGFSMVQAGNERLAAELGVALCRNGEAQAMMKGSLHTDDLMRAVMKSETGLRTARRISHVFLMDTPRLTRTLLVTDAAINIAPEFEDKIHIVQNAIDLAHALGIALPKVALLSAVETVNSKIPSTLEAAALCKMAERGQITGGILDGPLAFDTAFDPEAAIIKKLVSPVTGQVDIVLVPNLESGNMLAKELEYVGGARIAGIVLGARVPIILTSRANSAESRLVSCAVAVLLHYANHPVAAD